MSRGLLCADAVDAVDDDVDAYMSVALTEMPK